jgi:hypothetical protein
MKEVSFSPPEKKGEADDKKKTSGSARAKLIRTYRADVERLITTKKITRTHVAIAEEERRRALGQSAIWESPKPGTIFPAILAGIFLLVGVSILFYDLAGMSVPEFFPPKGEAHLFVIEGEKSEYIGLSRYTKDELIRAIRTLAREEKLSQGTHVRIAFRARTGTTTLPLPYQNLFKTLEAEPPDTFLRSIKPAYEGGLISAGETKGYLVFTTTYYENTVVGLLDWEPRMAHEFYPIVDPLRAEFGPLSEGAWRTQTWGDHDLRVFETPDGRVAFVYGWIDRKILIMTGNIQAWSELSRMGPQVHMGEI